MSEEIVALVKGLGVKARQASHILAKTTTEQKNIALEKIAQAIESSEEQLIAANSYDVEKAKQDGLANALIDRLTLNKKRITAMAQGVREVVALHDPVREIIREWTRPNGLRIIKRRVPIGVIGIIYESRPNVTCDAAILCLKTGNATLLRGGSEAFHSNLMIAQLMADALEQSELPREAVQLIPTTDRAAVKAMCEMDQFLDLIVPRGGYELINTVTRYARMPVIKHYHGVCHIFVDRDANLEMAEKIVVNAKCQRPGTCNAVETVLVDRAIADQFLPRITAALSKEGVELRGDETSRQFVNGLKAATEEDWTTEYLDLILSIRVVDGLNEALVHMDRYGSRHSDAIVTNNQATAERFLNETDSAAVYWNASTRFTDGGEFGFGAEIGISTDKLHARGPMALEELTTYKYQVIGQGQVRT